MVRPGPQTSERSLALTPPCELFPLRTDSLQREIPEPQQLTSHTPAEGWAPDAKPSVVAQPLWARPGSPRPPGPPAQPGPPGSPAPEPNWFSRFFWFALSSASAFPAGNVLSQRLIPAAPGRGSAVTCPVPPPRRPQPLPGRTETCGCSPAHLASRPRRRSSPSSRPPGPLRPSVGGWSGQCPSALPAPQALDGAQAATLSCLPCCCGAPCCCHWPPPAAAPGAGSPAQVGPRPGGRPLAAPRDPGVRGRRRGSGGAGP